MGQDRPVSDVAGSVCWDRLTLSRPPPRGRVGLEAGVPLHHVKQLLGHASISTTDSYLNASRIHLHESMARMDEARKSDTNVTHTPSTSPPTGAVGPAGGKVKSLLH